MMIPNYNYLRPAKVNDIFTKREPLSKIENLSVELYTNAVILPTKRIPGDKLLFGRGGVVAESGEYVALSSIPGRVEDSYQFSSEYFYDIKVVYAGYLVSHWGHFLVEGVSRLWYFLENDTTIDKYVFTVEEYRECTAIGNYKEFFQLLGVWDKIFIINKPTRFKEVVVPQRAYQRTKYYSEHYKKVFDVVAKKCYVSLC